METVEDLCKLDPKDFCKTKSCGICYEETLVTKHTFLTCCMCENFSMCIPCFHKYTGSDTVIYACTMTKSVNTSCPHCRCENGFALWPLIYGDKPPPPLEWFMPMPDISVIGVSD